jgi:hypothetical protein
MLSQSIPTFSLYWQASCDEERSRHIYPVEYEWAWIIIVDLTLEVNMLGGKHKPLSFFVSGWKNLFMGKPWVLAIMKDQMMVEYIDLLKSSYLWPFPKIWWIVIAKLTENIVCWFSIKFMLPTSMLWWIVTCWWEVYDARVMKESFVLVPCCYNSDNDASMSVSCFYRLLSLSLSKHVGMFVRFWFSLEDKRGLSLGELIRPFCIMFSYCYLQCFHA